MEKVKSIATINDYGHVRLRLRAFMDERGINRNQLARAIQANFAVVDKWYEGNVEKLDLDVLARLCHALECNVSDLLYYEEEPKQP